LTSQSLLLKNYQLEETSVWGGVAVVRIELERVSSRELSSVLRIKPVEEWLRKRKKRRNIPSE
jgi:hypothetical protein